MGWPVGIALFVFVLALLAFGSGGCLAEIVEELHALARDLWLWP